MAKEQFTPAELQTHFQATVSHDLYKIKTLSFRSRGRAVLYSGAYAIAGNPPRTVFSNWDYADQYAKKHNMHPVEITEGGKHLSDPNRFVVYNQEYKTEEIAIALWKLASREYARSIVGDLRTFVSCSSYLSTFRTIELPEILANKKIRHINGKPRAYFTNFRDNYYKRLNKEAKRAGTPLDHKAAAQKSMDATYLLIVREELRMDAASPDLCDTVQQRKDGMEAHKAKEIARKSSPQYNEEEAARVALMFDLIGRNKELLVQIKRTLAKQPKIPTPAPKLKR